MKKFFLTLGVAALSLSSFASQRILYSQNFETVSDAEAAGWSYGGTSMTIASDEYGKFLELSQGQTNGRNAVVTWGEDIFLNSNGESMLEDGTYTVSFDFSIKTNSNNQYNTEFTLFTNHAPRANETYRLPWTAGYLGPWNSYVFDMLQCNTAADTDMQVAIMAPLKKDTTTDDEGTETTTYTVDTTTPYTLASGNWYTVTCFVNTNTREVEYDVVDLSGNQLVAGTWEVPETNYNEEAAPVSMFVQGLNIMVARYATVIDIDNILVSFESSKEFANEPTIALTGLGQDAEGNLNLNIRTYTITFLDGETLHVKGTNGQEVTYEWADCDGAATYSTTTSGTLTAWTTSGSAKSEEVTTEVDCTPCALPAAEAAISSVTAGYGKTFTLTVSNADVPLRPTIFINYKFTPDNGGSVIEANGEASGVQVTLPSEGWLEITTEAFGYQSTTHKIKNDMEFAVKKVYDFARMTDDEQTAAGFTSFSVLNSSSTSGFNNWTARKRLYYYDAATETKDEDGNTVYTAVYPFGFISDDNTENVIEYSEIDADDNAAGETHFAGLDVYAGQNLSYMKHIGVYNNATTGGNYKNINVLNLDATDFVVYNTISSYGSDSNHPVVNTVDEYYAQLAGVDNVVKASDGTADADTGKYTVSCPVYRIDTVCTKLTIFSMNGEAGIENVAAEAAENNDPYYYTIDGLRLEKPNGPGLYIHQGRKLIIK